MDLSIEELKRMQSMHIMELKREELANAEDIVIDTKKCVESRIKIFYGADRKPFCTECWRIYFADWFYGGDGGLD